MKNLPFFIKCSDWVSKPLMNYCRDSNVYNYLKEQLMFGKSLSNLFAKNKNREHKIRRKLMRLPDEFLLNGVKLDRTHQEDLSEISQLSTQTLLIIYSEPTSHLKPRGSICSHIPCNNQSVDLQNKPTKWSPHELHKGSINTKMKTDTKLAKIKYLLSSLFFSFSKDKIRIKI